jgi:dimethylhistidine N-methyltransferase
MVVRLVPSDRTSAGGDRDSRFALDVHYYLSLEPRQLPSRYLYDALGSSLFEAICRLPWYPITRAETRLLNRHRREILERVDRLARIIELGCGSGEKLLTLLDRRAGTGPLELHLIDVSPTALAESGRALGRLDTVRVIAHQTPYEAGLAEVAARRPSTARTLALFLGSNLGNFDPPGAEEFLREIRAALRPGDCFLLGADLVKPEELLLLAYDDPLGVTAAFNRNLLVRINRELGGTFDLNDFTHEARWNAAASRVEMHLISRLRRTIRVEATELEFTIEEGESIWTESSYKYEPDDLRLMLGRAGFSPLSQWIDEGDRFALMLVEAGSAESARAVE